jgi:nucleoside-diphosphate-sugar epimerase
MGCGLSLEASGFRGEIEEFLSGLDLLVFNIPPGLRKNPTTDYVEKINHLLVALRKTMVPRLLFISSTSVYGRLQGRVDESTPPVPDSAAGKQLLEAEKLIWGDRISRATLIIRLGGLIGSDRHPVTTLSGKVGLPYGTDPVNLIQQEQAIRIIQLAIERTAWEGFLNAVHPDHPKKLDFYTREAERLALAPPLYAPVRQNDNPKQVLSRFAPELISIFSKQL